MKFILRLLRDLYRTYFPADVGQNAFAFIVHPRGYGDIISNVPVLKILPKKFVMRFFHLLWPFTVSRINGLKSLKSGREITGWVIGVPIFAHQMIENRSMARKKIARAVLLAKNKGARVVGLGGMTGSVTEGGAGLSKDGNMIITAGRAYTSFVVKSYVDDVIKRLELRKDNLIIAVVGAAGGVGTAVTRLLSNEPYKKIILIDLERKLKHIEDNLIENSVNFEITHQLRRIKEADIIITVTNAPEAVVESEDIKPGAVIIDDAQPSDISQEIIDNRDDIIVIEAGVISAHKKIQVGTNFRLANQNELYCCLGEVMSIVASDWDGEYSPRNITPELIKDISEISSQVGFKLAPYQAFGKIVTEERINKIKNIVKS